MLSVRLDPTMTLVGQAVDGDTVDASAIGRVTDLPELCRQLQVHPIRVAARERFATESLDIYRGLQNSVHIAMVPRYFELISWRSRLTDLSGTPILEIAQPHLSALDRFAKRAFDLCMSSAVLLAMLPLLLVTAIGVKLSSPGPSARFALAATGRRSVKKFRSMIAERRPHRPQKLYPRSTIQACLFTIGGSRRTRRPESPASGRSCRTGIYEIPQFINAFKGDMSIVCPRPFVPNESNVEGWATRRFEVDRASLAYGRSWDATT